MCGIVGIVGTSDVAQRLFDGLKRLEYRGYDSAGICTIDHGQLVRRRAEGKLDNLARDLADHPLHGSTGIAHTRWATHGAPTVGNAHPHIVGSVALVHNGIIENFKNLRDELLDPIFGDKARVEARSAGDDGQPVDLPKLGVGDRQRDLALERADVGL